MNFYNVVGFLLVVMCLEKVTGCPPTSSSNENNENDGPDPPGVWVVSAGKRAIPDDQKRHITNFNFTTLDKDNNGRVDACEWTVMTSNVREFVKILNVADKNEDNLLSFEEFEEFYV